jgi:hypothetical protein
VRPTTGAVSPEPGGSVLLTQPVQGERLIPTCEHASNPGDILRLLSVAVFLTVGEDRIRLSRKLTFAPTTAWKPMCDHTFFLGEPETAWTAGAKTQVWFTQPPRPRQELPTATRLLTRTLKSFGTGSGSDEPNPQNEPETSTLIGAELTLAPFPGNPTDHRLVLELEQECVVFPEVGEDGLTSLNLPLMHLTRFTPAKDLRIQVQVEFGGPWHFHGATLPETGHLENRVTWDLPGVPEADLKLLFSDEAPAEPEPAPAAPTESTAEKVVRYLMLGAVLIAVLGVMLLGMRGRRKAAKPAAKPAEKPAE